MIRRLLALLGIQTREKPAPYVWKPTGLKFTTARDYEQDKASAMFKRSQTHTATGRKLSKPRLVKSDKRELPANVVPMRKGGTK